MAGPRSPRRPAGRARPEPARIRYLVPAARTVRRLRSYGVPEERITFTGFPLPEELVGGAGLQALRDNLVRRIVRLDPARSFRRSMPEEIAHFLGPLPQSEEGRPPLVTFAVGGAEAQARLPALFVPGFRAAIEEGRIRLALVAGTRPEVAATFREVIAAARLEGAPGVEVLDATGFQAYYDAFNSLLARTDVLWTKPSELTFYAALGLPLIAAPPVGTHERYNLRWVREGGAALKQRDARFAIEWIADALADGTLAAAAWAGYLRLPKFGLSRVLQAIGATPSERGGREA